MARLSCHKASFKSLSINMSGKKCWSCSGAVRHEATVSLQRNMSFCLWLSYIIKVFACKDYLAEHRSILSISVCHAAYFSLGAVI